MREGKRDKGVDEYLARISSEKAREAAIAEARDVVIEAAKVWKKKVQRLYGFDGELCDAIQTLEELEQ
jgi:enhancing lycopene biosynthesis protein 2